jgi:hypothetical protein
MDSVNVVNVVGAPLTCTTSGPAGVVAVVAVDGGNDVALGVSTDGDGVESVDGGWARVDAVVSGLLSSSVSFVVVTIVVFFTFSVVVTVVAVVVPLITVIPSTSDRA